MGSLWSCWALWAAASFLWGLTQEATVNSRNTGGEEFLTTFLQNDQPGYGTASLCLFISSLSESIISVTILSQADDTSQKVTVKGRESATASASVKAKVANCTLPNILCWSTLSTRAQSGL